MMPADGHVPDSGKPAVRPGGTGSQRTVVERFREDEGASTKHSPTFVKAAICFLRESTNTQENCRGKG